MRVHIPCLDKTVRREMIEPIVSRNERHNEKTENQQINTKQQGVAAGGNDRNYAQAMRRGTNQTNYRYHSGRFIFV